MNDAYLIVTEQIASELEKGVMPWRKPWTNTTTPSASIVRPMRLRGIPYRGINVLLLWASAVTNGYTSPTWMTYRAALNLGARVRKGEHGTWVVYAGPQTKRITNEATGSEETVTFRALHWYKVFNEDQIDGLPKDEHAPPPVTSNERSGDMCQRMMMLGTFFYNCHINLDQPSHLDPCYSIHTDTIHMPAQGDFISPGDYYATLAHETIHWTGHKTRLVRDLSGRFGDASYAMEEMVAELGAAFLCADLGLAPSDKTSSYAAYMSTWLKVLHNDKRAIFMAASHAQHAADFVWQMQPADMRPKTDSGHSAATRC